MPLYEYCCDNGHVHEVIQKMDDPAPEACPECGKPVSRQMSTPGRARVRGGRRRKDIKFRKKGARINLQRYTGES